MKTVKEIWFYKYYIMSIIIVLFLVYLGYFIIIKTNKHDDYYAFRDVTYIGHGTYGIDGIDYTNSLESLSLGYSKGIRVIEVDFLFTSDGELVLNHYWDETGWKSYSTFLNNKINDKYTALTIDDLLVFMKGREDLYIVMDTKENEYDNNKTVYDVYREIVSKTKLYDEELLDRFIIQLYGVEDLKEVNKIYKFKNKMFTMYKLGVEFNIRSIVYYCLYNDIDSITIPYTHIMYNLITESDIRFNRSKNINVYINTINDIELYNKLLDMGVTGVYTDFLN